MKLADLPLGSLIVEFKPVNERTFNNSIKAYMAVNLMPGANDSWHMRIGAHHYEVRVDDPVKQHELIWLYDGVGHMEAWIEKSVRSKQDVTSLFIAVHKFHALHQLSEAVSIQVAEDILDGIIKSKGHASEYEQAVSYIGQECIMDGPNGTQRLIIRTIEDDPDSLVKSFRIYGKQGAFDVSRLDVGYRVKRHVRNVKQLSQTSLMILEGSIRFVDVSVMTQQIQNFKTELDLIVAQSGGSYLNVWNEYNQLERKLIVEKVRHWGWIAFGDKHELPTGHLRLYFQDLTNAKSFMRRIERANELDLVIAEDLPPYFSNEFSDMDDIREIHEHPVEIVGKHEDSIEVRLRSEEAKYAAEDGYLFVSIRGDSVRLDRRKDAWDLIRNLDTPIPGLGLLLERSAVYMPRTYKNHKVKTSRLSNYFDVQPNTNQLQALELTLKTPDIMLIQGPPGTGKTQVISAISRLIADERQQGNHDLGKVLLTSYQHYAVDNVAERTKVMDLPTPKIGGKRGVINSSINSVLQEWKKNLHERVDYAHKLRLQPTVSTVKQYVQDQLLGYQRKPGNHAETLHMLQSIGSRCLGHLTPKQQEEFDAFVDGFSLRTSFNSLTDVEQRSIVRAVRSLRTEPVAFMDDGPSTALKLLLRLEQVTQSRGVSLLTAEQMDILQQAANWEADTLLLFMEQLQQISEALLLNLGANPDAGRVNVDVNNVLTDVLENLFRAVQYYPGHVEAVAQKFLDDLENDPRAVEEAIRRYSAVLAATCQQSGGHNFHTPKASESLSYFDTVIVDEASRASPLDLLIPIVQAKRRIILVGDHRQLPQILEPDVESNLSGSAAETRDLLQKSLFERLFTYMDELSKKDGITRRITLKTQYRMHPRLAQFVSDTFYAPYGEAFSSFLPADYFSHGIDKYGGRIAIWIDVPLVESTHEQSFGGSKRRRAEAAKIAIEVKRMLDLKQGLSVGIITFYSAQVIEINNELRKIGVKADSEQGLELAYEYSTASLQVGTVDEFQGKEFDVVFLSPVRSNKNDNFGFLTLENRLCVALSRQKNLLVVVGDKQMYSSKRAEQEVPGLAQFYKLCCEEPYGLII